MHYYNPLTHHVRPIEGTNDWHIICNDNPQLGSRVNEKPEPEIPFRLIDITEKSPDKTGYIRLDGSIVINVKEYGTYCEGHVGEPIFIENYEGKLRVALWADINREDCTHSVIMEDARLASLPEPERCTNGAILDKAEALDFLRGLKSLSKQADERYQDPCGSDTQKAINQGAVIAYDYCITSLRTRFHISDLEIDSVETS